MDFKRERDRDRDGDRQTEAVNLILKERIFSSFFAFVSSYFLFPTVYVENINQAYNVS